MQFLSFTTATLVSMQKKSCRTTVCTVEGEQAKLDRAQSVSRRVPRTTHTHKLASQCADMNDACSYILRGPTQRPFSPESAQSEVLCQYWFEILITDFRRRNTSSVSPPGFALAFAGCFGDHRRQQTTCLSSATVQNVRAGSSVHAAQQLLSWSLPSSYS